MFFFVSIFLVNILFARLLGAAESGELYYTINNFSILTLVVSLSLESGITYFLSRKEIDEKELIAISFFWSMIGGGLAVIFVILTQNKYFLTRFYNPSYTFLFIAGTLLTTYFSGLFFARREFLLPHLIPGIINFVIGLFCISIIILQKHTNTAAMITAYFASFMVNGILLGIFYKRKYSFPVSLKIPSRSTLFKLFRYSGFAFIANIVSFLAYRIDYWILKSFSPHIVTSDALGNYIQVAKLVQLFLFAPTIVATVIFPAVASGTDLHLNKEIKKMIWRLLFLSIVACGMVLIVGNWLFIFVYGNSFSQMYMCFIYSIPAILSISVVRIMASYFAGINKIIYNFFGGMIALSVIVLLNFRLVPLMGINGAALADSAGYVSLMIFLLIFFRYQQKILS